MDNIIVLLRICVIFFGIIANGVGLIAVLALIDSRKSKRIKDDDGNPQMPMKPHMRIPASIDTPESLGLFIRAASDFYGSDVEKRIVAYGVGVASIMLWDMERRDMILSHEPLAIELTKMVNDTIGTEKFKNIAMDYEIAYSGFDGRTPSVNPDENSL